ncbi:MAG TPA: CHAD domain-containing protein [Chloroflexota bacterium]|nr:CHAD domain-containing protein [Chloroflexota bacterium]
MRIWPTIGGRMRLTDLARARVEQQLAAFCAREAGVRMGVDPEDVHQMRVASRRLRAALQLFEAVLPPAVNSLRDELAWIAAALGQVRDLDVQIASLDRAASGLSAETDALRAVLDLFDARRSAARDALRLALATDRFATLVTGLRDLAEQPQPDGTDDSLDVADRLIRDTHRRLRKAGEQLHPEASTGTLHRARIRAKQFRYALECFSELYGKPARRLMRRAARLQDVLGGAQDAAVLQELLRRVSQPEHDLPPASVFLLGQLSEVYAERMRLARAEAPDAYARLTGRPWKRLKQRARTAILET